MKNSKGVILFVSHEASVTGAPLFLFNLLKSINNDDFPYDIVVHFVNGGPLVGLYEKEGFRVTAFEKANHNLNLFLKYYNRIEYYLKFFSLVVKIRPKMLYSNSILNIFQVVGVRMLGIKTLVHMHEGINIASKLGVIFRFSAFFTSKYICGSYYTSNVLKKLTGRVGVVIHNGIDVAESEDIDKCDKSVCSLSVVGTIDRNKAQMVAIMAVERLVKMRKINVKLNIFGRVGDRNYYDEICDYVENNGLRSIVTFIDFVNTIDEAYRKTDVLIVPSLDEAFPTVILEAMAYRKPVIASNTGGIPEIVSDGFTGLLFIPGNVESLVGKLLILLNNDYKQMLIHNAYQNVADNFSHFKAIRKIVQVIDSMIGECRSVFPAGSQ